MMQTKRNFWQNLNLKLNLNFLSLVFLSLFILNQPLRAAETPSSASARNPEWAAPIEESLNLYRVSPALYRSEQLEKKDVGLLKKLGIKTVVSLRAFHSDDALLNGSGIEMKRVRIYSWKMTNEKVVKALRAIKAGQKNGPVLLHCQHGADRTGTISAMVRMLDQGWTREAAIDELKNGGYGYHAVWKNMIEYLQNVDLEKIRKQVEK